MIQEEIAEPFLDKRDDFEDLKDLDAFYHMIGSNEDAAGFNDNYDTHTSHNHTNNAIALIISILIMIIILIIIIMIIMIIILPI